VEDHLETYIFKKVRFHLLLVRRDDLFNQGVGVFGFGGRWSKMWMVSMGKDIIYYKNHTGQQALERTSISMIIAAAPSRGNEKEFELRLNDGRVIYHLAESVEGLKLICTATIVDLATNILSRYLVDRDRWIAFIENKKKQFMDLLPQLGIDEDNLEGLKEIESGPNIIDPVEVKNGRQQLLIQVNSMLITLRVTSSL